MTRIHSIPLRIQEPPGSVRDFLMWKQVRRLSAMIIVVSWTLLGIGKVAGEQSKPGEYQVKAAYLYNFARFIAWPARAAAGANNPFAICVLGQDPFGPALNATLAGATINGKSAVARNIPDPAEATNCQILFICASEGDRLKQILATVKDASVLTVSDLPEFSRSGGMVQFTTVGSHVRFEVNLAPAERVGLVLSSDLLKVAVNVIRGGSSGE